MAHDQNEKMDPTMTRLVGLVNGIRLYGHKLDTLLTPDAAKLGDYSVERRRLLAQNLAIIQGCTNDAIEILELPITS